MKPKALILNGVGINSQRELAEAFILAGAQAEVVHISELEINPAKLLDYQLVGFPGGFSYGDHLASGRILANLLRLKLGENLQKLMERGTPMIGICNGFQVMVKMGLLPARKKGFVQELSLVHNNSGRYEDRWVNLKVNETARAKSPWLTGLDYLPCPVRHGEGKLVCGENACVADLQSEGLIALRYADATGKPTQNYPQNPNGSEDAIAGLISPNGLILGLMPHPEVALSPLQFPDWTRRPLPTEDTPCLKLFKNIVRTIS